MVVVVVPGVYRLPARATISLRLAAFRHPRLTILNYGSGLVKGSSSCACRRAALSASRSLLIWVAGLLDGRHAWQGRRVAEVVPAPGRSGMPISASAPIVLDGSPTGWRWRCWPRAA
jgi:hypothetical protein